MKTHIAPQPSAENLWLLACPLKMLGADLRRNVTLIRLRSGKLVIHSAAPFSPEDMAAIQEFGEPRYLAPEGFSEVVGFPTTTIVLPLIEWDGKLPAMEIQGAPEARDTALLHILSRTLILTELVFNFGSGEPIWTELLLHAAVGGEHGQRMSRPIKAGVRAEVAVQNSLAVILGWDFDRVIAGHGDVIEHGGKTKLRTALTSAGFPLK